MAGIRVADTKPELQLRRLLHAAGHRYRLHPHDLPGKPDLVFPRRRIAIFVHGCFWHRHEGCHWCSTPGSNSEFWGAKFARNVERDRDQVAALSAMDWRVGIVWECSLRGGGARGTINALDKWFDSDEPSFETGLVRERKA
ncbi:very short patch repair endonuclease [Sphingomonas echinoides]